MHQEVEIQAKIKNLKEVEKKLNKVGKFIKTRKQIDKYFITLQNDFFAKEPPIEYLRVRYEEGKSHLNYSFLHFRKDGWLDVTDEYETLVEKPEIAEQIFRKIGLINIVTVQKIRKYFDCGKFEVTLDQVKGLGNFMEVEAKKVEGGVIKTRNACMDFLNSLNIKYNIEKDAGYLRMLYKKLKNKK